MEEIKMNKTKYPILVMDLAQQNYFLKIILFSLIGLMTVMIAVLAYQIRKGPLVMALNPTGTVASLSHELQPQHVEAAVKEYLGHRYNWGFENIQLEIKKSEAFISQGLVSSFQKSMLEVQKYTKDKKIIQRVYPKSVIVSLKDKTVTVEADRITEFESLKAATILKTTLNFEIDSPTPSNPWGIYFTKEVETGGGEQR